MLDFTPMGGWGRLREGIIQGLLAWGAYWVVEVALYVFAPLAIGKVKVVSAIHWEFHALLLLSYLFAGLLFGSLGGIVSRLLDKRRASASNSGPGHLQQTVAATLLVACHTANLYHGFDPAIGADVLALAVAIGMLLLLFASLVRPKQLGWLAVLSEPWTLTLILLGVPLLAANSGATQIGALAFMLIGVIVVSRWLQTRSLTLRLALLAVSVPAISLAVLAACQDLQIIRPTAAISRSLGERPNVLFLVLDTVRSDHTSLYGYERDTTPELRRLAKEGVLYTRATATSNYTLSTHASMFTGLYPRTHGAINYPPGKSNGRPLSDRYPTLAELLAKEGYFNLAVVANTGYVGPGFGMNRGFHTFDARNLKMCVPDSWISNYYLRAGMLHFLSLFADTLKFDQHTRGAKSITTDVLSLLDAAVDEGRPFFLFVNYMDAHSPYMPVDGFDTLYPGKNPALNFERFHETEVSVLAQRRTITEEEKKHYLSQYDGAIAYIDSQIGRIIEYLRAAGLYENTMIIIVSDHGEAFGEHAVMEHAVSLYQHQVSVPLVIKFPGQQSGATISTLVSQVDLTPTVLDTLGFQIPAAVQGRSVAPGATDPNRSVFAEEYAMTDIRETRPDYPSVRRAVFKNELKLITSSDGSIEMYDLSQDRAELSTISSENSRGSELTEELEQWIARYDLQVGPATNIDAETLERLRGLGYVQ